MRSGEPLPSAGRRPSPLRLVLERRRVLQLSLIAAATSLSSGCRLRVGSPRPAGSRSAPASGAADDPASTADRAALDSAAALGLLLQQSFARAARLRPDLSPALDRLSADFTAHQSALAALGSSGSAGSGAVKPTFPALTAVNAPSVLAQIERFAVTTYLQPLAAVDGRTARLLASMAACSSAHISLLARLPAEPKASRPHTHTGGRQ